jgi:two-component SAPR family response regulator
MASKLPPAKSQDSAGPRILVLEDEFLLAIEVEDILRTLGCQVVGPLSRLNEAMDMMDTLEVEGAVLDVNLHGNQKVYPVARILQDRGIPFVFTTAYGSSDLDRDFSETRILSKPFNPAELREWIGSLR